MSRYTRVPSDAVELGDYAASGVDSGIRYEITNSIETVTNATEQRGGYYAAVIRLLTALLICGLAVVFIFLASFNVWNTRIDYNTDYYGRDCLADDDDAGACWELSLKRVHAVDVNWLFASAYTTSAVSLVTMGLILYWIHFSAQHWDADIIDVKGYVRSLANKSNWTGVNAFLQTLELLANESLNGFTLQHNIIQLTFTPTLGVVMFAMCGVRDFIMLLLIFGLYCLSALTLHAAQLAVRARRRRGTKLPNIPVMASGEFGVKMWLPLFIHVALALFLWCLFLVYAFKYPHESRTWAFILSSVFYTVIQAVQLVYFVGYFGAHDVRFGGKDSKSSMFEVLYYAATAPFRFLGRGPFWLVFGLVLFVLYTPSALAFAVAYSFVRICTVVYLFFDTPLQRRKSVTVTGGVVMNIVLHLLNGLLVSLGLIICGGFANIDNIARIVFPVTQTLIY